MASLSGASISIPDAFKLEDSWGFFRIPGGGLQLPGTDSEFQDPFLSLDCCICLKRPGEVSILMLAASLRAEPDRDVGGAMASRDARGVIDSERSFFPLLAWNGGRPSMMFLLEIDR